MAQYQLVMRKGPNPGKTYALGKNEMWIGRDIANDIVINDAEVSRQHAHLVMVGGGYGLEDNGSTNGTFVNEIRLMGQVLLQPGNVIRMGDNIVLAYELAQDPEATLASPGAGAKPMAQAPIPPQSQPPIQRPSAPQPQAPAYQPPPQQVQGSYAGQVPPGPDSEPRSRNSRAILIGCGALLVLGACIAVAALWYIDANYLWCDVFGSLVPGCP